MLAPKATIFFHSDDSHAFPFTLLGVEDGNAGISLHWLTVSSKRGVLILCIKSTSPCVIEPRANWTEKFLRVGIFWEALGWSAILAFLICNLFSFLPVFKSARTKLRLSQFVVIPPVVRLC